jgi:hypothetical protein
MKYKNTKNSEWKDVDKYLKKGIKERKDKIELSE